MNTTWRDQLDARIDTCPGCDDYRWDRTCPRCDTATPTVDQPAHPVRDVQEAV